jgi:hypothetical protein
MKVSDKETPQERRHRGSHVSRGSTDRRVLVDSHALITLTTEMEEDIVERRWGSVLRCSEEVWCRRGCGMLYMFVTTKYNKYAQ